MKLSLFSLLFLAFISLSLATQDIPNDLLKSHFDGRSGDIQIYSKQSSNTMGSVTFINSPQFSSEVTSLPETEVADLVSHFNGLSPFQPNRDRSHFPAANFFSKPKANLFLYLSTPLSAPLSLPKSQTFSLSREAYYSSSSQLPQLTSILSGVTPSVHGVISEQWIDRLSGSSSSITQAFDSWTQGIFYSANLADLWTLNYMGKALVLSYANNKAVSRAMNAKPFVVEDKSSGNYGFYLNHNKMESSIDKENKIRINIDHLRAFYENKAPCGMNFEDQTDFEVLAENGIPQLMMRSLKTAGSQLSKYVKDEVPDMFSFGFNVKKAEEKYGKDSDKMKCVNGLVEETMKNIIASLNNLYEESVITEIVSLNNEARLEPVNIIKQELGNHVDSNSTLKQLMPNVYLRGKMSQETIEELSEKVTKAIEIKGFEAVSMPLPKYDHLHSAYKHVQSLRQSTQNGTATNSSGISNMAVFQTCLWTGIGLGVAAVVGSYIMYSIDASGDPVLYHHDINHPTAN